MAINVKKTTLWRREMGNRAGALAEVLAPFGAAGTDLGVVMGYRVPGHPDQAVIEIAPLTGKTTAKAATSAGLAASSIPALLVTGDNKAGLGHAMSRDLGAAGISMTFLIAQVVGRKYCALFGFESEADCDRAVPLIKKAKVARKR